MSASRSETAGAALGPDEPGPGEARRRERGGGPGAELLAALLDGMDAALCAFDADGVITHWNREAERILGWSAGEAVGRRGFAGWAVRSADAGEVEARLLAAMDAPGRQVHEFALLRKDGSRVLVRTQSARVPGVDGKPTGVYTAFSEVHAQIDLERSIALSEALFDDASWGVVLVDVDLRPTVVNAHAARALGAGRVSPLGRPLGELVVRGVEELEGALHHVLAEGAPRGLVELWVTLRATEGQDDAEGEGERRRCWRSGFLRLASPLAEEPVPLGVGWLFHDVTEQKLAEQEADRLRFRASQLHRAGRAAVECEDPMEAATAYVDFALAGFADHALIDLVEPGGDRLVRAAATPSGAPGPCVPVAGAGPEGSGIPVRYPAGHPALQSADRVGSVRASAGAGAVTRAGARARGGGSPAVDVGGRAAGEWAEERQWPGDTAHALCTPLRSRGRTLGVLTFLRTASRPPFERPDAVYAESVATLAAASLDLARLAAPGEDGGP
ncbi:PAS domain-containing protein [Streptomyces sp. HNM0663]|uniref:PAS domain-containing protein n=1 Tax=Streptomyces chengmaiensis TaxID=3040919 RepID=A0ABT6HTQ4_9ACTN|nr:PAS domain-containing protein [Streptomyces chengmaiensis]MDH2392085.1 PAS domain-containing protein [Streptomyces chengmaiensis]